MWPENVIDVNTSPTAGTEQVAAEAARLDAPIAVGVTEDAGERFTNAQVVVAPSRAT